MAPAGKTEVYTWTCRPNGKQYVGITKRSDGVKARRREHLSHARRGVDRPLYNAIRKHGEDAFEFVHIATAFSEDDAKAIERWLIADLGTMVPAGYNLTEGGEGTNSRKATDAQRAALSVIKKEFFSDPANLEAMRQRQLGTRASDETKAKMAESQRLRHSENGGTSAATRAKIGAAHKGRKHSAEFRAKISAVQKGKTIGAAQREKIAASLRGRPKSEEHRQKIAENNRAMGERRKLSSRSGGRIIQLSLF